MATESQYDPTFAGDIPKAPSSDENPFESFRQLAPPQGAVRQEGRNESLSDFPPISPRSEDRSNPFEYDFAGRLSLNDVAPQQPPPAPPAVSSPTVSLVAPVVPAPAPSVTSTTFVASTAPTENPFTASIATPQTVSRPLTAEQDPFAVFNTMPAPGPTVQAAAPVAEGAATGVQSEADFWATMGFGPSTTSVAAPPQPAQSNSRALPTENPEEKEEEDTTPLVLDSSGLPAGGETYSARINTPQLGAMFFTAAELERSILRKTRPDVIEALGNRPLVAYTGQNTAAYASGIGVGHILTSVNGAVPSDPREASKLIRSAPRPVLLKFYALPKIRVTLHEAKSMVKYDTRSKDAPASALDWKAKYVVVGGIISDPWQLNMYRSKAEYDTAVMETQAGLPLSVKVKQWTLRGARILHDDKPPKGVHYPQKPTEWKYIVVLPARGYPIKISCNSAEELKPVQEGIRHFLSEEHRNYSENIEDRDYSQADFAHMMNGGYYGR